MRLIYAVSIFLLVTMTSAKCQQNADNWFDEGFALDAQGKYDEAIKAYDLAISLNPNYAHAWYNRGLDLYRQGQVR